ncbi:FUSC family protein [Hydrogenimonas sp.]
MSSSVEAAGTKRSFWNPKLLHAFKASLALSLSYLIPFWLGWPYASTAAIVIMVIAAADTVEASFMKGFLRTVGTALGAAIGIALIALVPQDRTLYLMALSLVVTLFIYLSRAYRGDNTIFFLTAMMAMMVFMGGNVEGAFKYSLDRTFITIFGVALYTLIGIYLFPTGDTAAATRTDAPSTGFDWLDPDHFYGAFVSFLVFWATVGLWYWFNPPGGFLIIVLAVSFSLFTAATPISPMLLVIAFSVGFFAATLSYIFVLPHLHEAWELGLFIFLYGFVGFYLFKPEMGLFFLMGLAVMSIDNPMAYDFALFLNTLFIFYLFLFVLLFFYYFPVPTTPQRMVRVLKRRIERMLAHLQNGGGFARRYAQTYLLPTIAKFRLWAAQLDSAYFGLDAETLGAYADAAEGYARALLKGGDLAQARAAWRNAAGRVDFNALKGSRF